MSKKTPSSADAQQPSDTPASAVRDRVRQHVRRALAAGGVVAALGSESCQKNVGYMVVDMMPEPAKCDPHRLKDYRIFFHARRWNDSIEFSASVADPGHQEGVLLAFDPDSIAITGGAILGNVQTGEMLLARITNKPGASAIGIAAGGRCGDLFAAEIAFEVSIDLTRDANQRGELPIRILRSNVPGQASDPFEE